MSIFLTETRQTAGLMTDVNQTFYANIVIPYKFDESNVYVYELPIIEPSYGTRNFKSQDYRANYANFSDACRRYNITGTTEEISAVTITHEIFKLDYETWGKYLECYNYNINLNRETDSTQKTKTLTQTTKKTDDNGRVTYETIETSSNEKESEAQFNFKDCPSYADIKEKLQTPLYQEVVYGTDILYNNYELLLPEFIKDSNNETQRIYTDKAQFLIVLKVESTKTLEFRGGGYVEGLPQRTITISSVPSATTIDEGPASGITVYGHFSTYFVIPNVAILEDPIMSGDLSTFTPEFKWSNTDDGDYQAVQITYFSADTGFTGTVFTYKMEEYTELDGVRSYTVPLQSNRTFRYRVANIKEVNPNIFGVSQQVATYTDSIVARTQNTDLSQRVYGAVDSKYTSEDSVYTRSLMAGDICTPGDYILSGTVSGSTVTGATMQLVYPSGNYVTNPTDTVGFYSFDNLLEGEYTLNTYYRGYLDDARTFTLTGDTTLNVNMKLLWSNSWDTWGKLASETYNY